MTANLQHPNLLPFFDSGEANGLLFYVMPFVMHDGQPLVADFGIALAVSSAGGDRIIDGRTDIAMCTTPCYSSAL